MYQSTFRTEHMQISESGRAGLRRWWSRRQHLFGRWRLRRGGRAVEMLGSEPSTMAAGTVRALSTVSRCRWETCPTARTAKKSKVKQSKAKQRNAKTRKGQCHAVGASRDRSASWWRVSTMPWNGEWDEQENVLQYCTYSTKVLSYLVRFTRLPGWALLPWQMGCSSETP
jgi:hypothetical protein